LKPILEMPSLTLRLLLTPAPMRGNCARTAMRSRASALR
jgi:hypothetical protein